MDKNVKISYAQNREDIILAAMLKDVKKGFYVDIGANHPTEHSVTKLFYDRGWRGINIEPNPSMYKLLIAHRRGDINLNLGVGNKKGKFKLRLFHSADGLEGLSTISNKIKQEYESHATKETRDYTDIEIKVETLSKILAEHSGGKTINFMKVDVEGLEYEVLDGNDWKKFRPQIICIESNHMVKDWRPILQSNGYKIVFFDGLNDYYAATELGDVEFDYPSVFLSGEEILNKVAYERQLHLRNLSHKLLSQHHRIAELERQLQYLAWEANQQKSLKGQLKSLYFLADNKIMRSIDKRGYERSVRLPLVKYPSLSIKNKQKPELIKLARVHDAKKYFHYAPLRQGMKPHYRLLAKTYRTSRDLGKKTIRVAKRGKV